MKRKRWVQWVGASLISVPMWVGMAQDVSPTQRDVMGLATRYLSYSGEVSIPELSPQYAIGDTFDFWVSRQEALTPVQVEARLIAATAMVYVWAEEGITLSPEIANALATGFTQTIGLLRQSDQYRSLRLPSNENGGSLRNPADLVTLTDIDGDSHWYVLLAKNLAGDDVIFTNPNDVQMLSLVPNGYSNQHEMFYVNMSALSEADLQNQLYAPLMVNAVFDEVVSSLNPNLTPWLVNALSINTQRTLLQIPISDEEVVAYFGNMDVGLTRSSTLESQPITQIGQQVFLSYLQSRYGVMMDAYTTTSQGMDALDELLTEQIDFATGAVVTGNDAFADFVMASALNLPFGDGRYEVREVDNSLRAYTWMFQDLAEPVVLSNQSVNPYGAMIYVFSNGSAPQTVTTTFIGSDRSPRLPFAPPRQHNDSYYWSGTTVNSNHHMTRAFNLQNVNQAELTFDAWFDLAHGWNYAYVSVSTDDGATWTPLHAEPQGETNVLNPETNPFGMAYGAGMTGVSNLDGVVRFPALGIFAGEDMVIAAVNEGGAADRAGILANDVIIGQNGARWGRLPNILDVLAEYEIGDTIDLMIQRGDETLDIPVTLGERLILPTPQWVSYSLDLNPYLGQTVGLRFETVFLPQRDNLGFALDNIRIDALNYLDTADTRSDWILQGMSQVDNNASQAFIVQAAALQPDTERMRVRRLLNADASLPVGEWTFDLAPNEIFIVTVSAVSEDVFTPATFNLRFSSVE